MIRKLYQEYLIDKSECYKQSIIKITCNYGIEDYAVKIIKDEDIINDIYSRLNEKEMDLFEMMRQYSKFMSKFNNNVGLKYIGLSTNL